MNTSQIIQDTAVQAHSMIGKCSVGCHFACDSTKAKFKKHHSRQSDHIMVFVCLRVVSAWVLLIKAFNVSTSRCVKLSALFRPSVYTGLHEICFEHKTA